jgi:RNA recognition motif-containing protein
MCRRDCRYYARDEPPGTSVFVRNLPPEVTTEKLAAAFKEFGPLRGANPVNLRIMKGKESIAFVDFEDTASQQAAIAGPVVVDGHQVGL